MVDLSPINGFMRAKSNVVDPLVIGVSVADNKNRETIIMWKIVYCSLQKDGSLLIIVAVANTLNLTV